MEGLEADVREPEFDARLSAWAAALRVTSTTLKNAETKARTVFMANSAQDQTIRLW
ncbi:MAG: hypothetical protein SGJ19_02480 [Planctomycetia bacterium]|nr:hypothetical protein [Planctomycetia bacterium]